MNLTIDQKLYVRSAFALILLASGLLLLGANARTIGGIFFLVWAVMQIISSILAYIVELKER